MKERIEKDSLGEFVCRTEISSDAVSKEPWG